MIIKNEECEEMIFCDFEEEFEENDRLKLTSTDRETSLWMIMEQSLHKLRHLQRPASGDQELQRLLVRDTFRKACWELTLQRVEQGNDYGNEFLMMARLMEECLMRTGLLGRIKIILEPNNIPEEPPIIKLPIGKRAIIS